MDKNQREERRRQEDIALNRGLLWVGAAILMELLLMLVNKYYINYYSTVESINMVYAFDAGLKAVRIVALIALAASAVWCFLRFSREGRTGTMPLVLVAAFSAVTAIAHITICFKDAGVRMLFLLVPAWAALALVYYLYQREFFYSAFYTGLGTMLLWMLRHKDSTVDPSSSRLTTYVFLAPGAYRLYPPRVGRPHHLPGAGPGACPRPHGPGWDHLRQPRFHGVQRVLYAVQEKWCAGRGLFL